MTDRRVVQTGRYHGELLDALTFVEQLNAAGWVASAGIPWKLQELPVTKASLSGETLKIEVGGHSFELPSDRILLVDPWTVKVLHTVMRRQQRKMIDGGGWHEVPGIGVAFSVRNPALEESIRRVRDEKARREEEERQRREAAEHEAKRQEFVARLTQDFVGKKLARIDVVGEDLHLEFDDGSKLSIELAGGDTYDAWIDVNGISLHCFKADTYR
ncbi:MAG: hypothetical protein WC242_00295 [Candidatus Paceibacterota bacterium]